MNTLANMPRFIMKFLQSQNVKRNVVKQFDNSKSNIIIDKSNDNLDDNSNNIQNTNVVKNLDNNQSTNEITNHK